MKLPFEPSWPPPSLRLRKCEYCGRFFAVVLNARRKRHKFAGLFRRKYCDDECARAAARQRAKEARS